MPVVDVDLNEVVEERAADTVAVPVVDVDLNKVVEERVADVVVVVVVDPGGGSGGVDDIKKSKQLMNVSGGFVHARLT